MQVKHYTIAQVSSSTGLSPDTLRYYERMGLVAVPRNASGYRSYSNHDIAWVKFLKRLKATGMPLKEIRKLVQLKQQGDTTLQARQAIMERHKQQVERRITLLQRELRLIDKKIDYYRQLQS